MRLGAYSSLTPGWERNVSSAAHFGVMSPQLTTSRLTRYAMLAVAGAATLSLAACGSTTSGTPSAAGGASSTAKSVSPSAPASPPASTAGPDRISGLIASTSGATIQVTHGGDASDTATVNFTPSTQITDVTPAQLADITTGSCVMVRPTRDSATSDTGALTAREVLVSVASNGTCPPAGNPRGHGVRGTVASVTGGTIVVTGTDAGGNPSQQSIAVTDSTVYAKRAVADSTAITEGTCIAARGTKDDSGALQATMINLRPAVNGACPGVRP
jgi:hypothetical protein